MHNITTKCSAENKTKNLDNTFRPTDNFRQIKNLFNFETKNFLKHKNCST